MRHVPFSWQHVLVMRCIHTRVQVSQELIRMAILWHEQWHEALEEASRQYFGDSNVPGMLATLSPLHRRMREQGAVTLKEIAFVSVCPAVLPSCGGWLGGQECPGTWSASSRAEARWRPRGHCQVAQ